MRARRKLDVRSTLLWRTQRVTRAPNGVDECAPVSAIDLAAQSADVRLDHTRMRIEVYLPDVLQQHAAGDHLLGMAHQVLEQPKLARQKIDRLAAARDRP